MRTCLSVYDDSLKFSRAAYGVITLLAFFLRSEWLILAVSALMALGTVSMKLNLFYRLHTFFFKRKPNVPAPATREYGELRFVSGMTALLLLLGFLLVYFNVYTDIAWIYILVVALLIFLACFVGFCVATLMYIFLKKALAKNNS